MSEQLTLWNQMGSQVERGRMIVLPVSGSIVYIQPVYLKAAARLKIPQLKRIIICKNETVVMEPTLEEGFAKLESVFNHSRNEPGGGSMSLTRPFPRKKGSRRTQTGAPATIVRSSPNDLID